MCFGNTFEVVAMEKKDEIDAHTRTRIFNSARHIAESVRKINHEELSYLVRLKQLLEL